VNEIELMRKFNHKNLMRLFEVYESDNSIYVSVELLEGGQLYDKIKSKHKFTLDEVQASVRGLLMGLEHMHEKRCMHRDLKPENILLRKEGDYDCVIADFGLSTWADEPEYLFVRCGTPGYVAPEIVNLKDLKAKCDPICDMFSLGVIFHILLLGKSPFPGKTYNEVLSQNRGCNINFEL
jgi:serine/threonine protein kinase